MSNINKQIEIVNKFLQKNKYQPLNGSGKKAGIGQIFDCPNCHNENTFIIDSKKPYNFGCQFCELVNAGNCVDLGYKEEPTTHEIEFAQIKKEIQFVRNLPSEFVNSTSIYLGGAEYYFTPEVVRTLFSVINKPVHIRRSEAYQLAESFDLEDNKLKFQSKTYLNAISEVMPLLYVKHIISYNIVDLNIVAEKKKSAIQTTFHYYYYVKNRGIYEHITDRMIIGVVESIIDEIVPPDNITSFSKFRRVTTEQLNQKLSLCQVVDFEKYETKKIINFLNGLYDLEENTFTQHTKDHYTRYQVNANYLPDADILDDDKPVNFLTALDTWFDDNETKNEALKILYYMIADMDRSEQVAIVLRGDGGDGKGEFAKLCRAIIPEDRTAAVRLEELQSNNVHITANLYGKMLNIADETRKDVMIDDGIFKAVTGGSFLEANFKHKQPFIFKNKALFLILSNHELNTTDTTRGMFRRLKGLVFQKIPASKKQLQFFDKKLLPELDKIVKYIIVKGGELYNAFGFIQTESDKAILKETAENNPIYSYWVELLEDLPETKSELFTDEPFISTKHHYDKYKDFCKEKRIQTAQY
jgi:P4 family phage/plasmid primase-like protien